MTPRRALAAAAGLPEPSPWLTGWFRRYARRYLARHFHAVRLSRQGGVPAPRVGENLVVYLNHPSWWDPLAAFFLAHRLYPDRRHFGPIDAAALARYRLLGRLGFFGIEPEGLAGARRFLAVSEAVLARPGAALWVTPQGGFADPLRRPVVLRPGLARLASRLATAERPVLFVPLALEYPFWQERFPEALARFGEPVSAAEAAAGGGAALAASLAAAQHELAAEAVARDPRAFYTLVGGRAGVGGAYDLWRSLAARFTGRPFEREHDPQ